MSEKSPEKLDHLDDTDYIHEFLPVLDHTLTSLEIARDTYPDKLHVAPWYICETSKREKLLISSYYSELGSLIPGSSVDNARFNESHLICFFALNDENDLVGIRTVDVRNNHEDSALIASGHTITRIRDEGYSLPMEMAVEDFLQRLSNSSGMEVIWSEVNTNMLEHEAACEAYVRGELSDEDLERKTQEAERWHSIFGRNSKLGFKNGRKVIKPQEMDLNWWEIEQIVLKRRELACDDGKTRIKSEVSKIKPFCNKQELASFRKHGLRLLELL